jgi:beta-lactamase regulating signal transducer with metallopeptidase domain
MEFSYLGFAGDGLSWFLRVGAGFVLCLGIVHLLKRPHYRFLTWLWFLVLSSLYWGALVLNRVFGIASKSGPAHVPHAPVHFSYASHINVPVSWALTLQRGVSPVVAAYLGVFLVLLSAKTWKHWKLHRLVKSGRPAAANLDSLLSTLCEEAGIRNCSAIVLPGISSPATAFWRKPQILLPEVCEKNESQPEVLTTLYHELTHIRRRDYLWANVSDVLCALLFFHPAVWQARKRMRLERELACDEAVVAAQPDHRADYATTLARFVRFRMLQQDSSLGVDLATGQSFLGTRIRLILADPERPTRWRNASSAVGVLAFFFLFGGICPSLSLILDVAAQKQLQLRATSPPADKRVHAVSGFARHKADHRSHEPSISGEAEPAAYPDNLTTLRVHSQVESDPTLGVSPRGNTSPGPYEVDRQTFRDSSGFPGYNRPTVSSVVLATVGGIEAAAHGDRTSRHPHTGAPR